MKGLKKCFTLLSFLFTIFMFSLNVCSDTNALKYELNYIPFVHPITYANNGHILYEPLLFETESSSVRLTGNSMRWFYSSLSGSNCVYGWARYVNPSEIANRGVYQIRYYLMPTDDSFSGEIPEIFYCNPNGQLPSNFLSNTLPSGIVNDDLRSYLPYRYPYNGAYINSNYTEEGLNAFSRLDFAELFTTDIPEDFTKIDIPLGISNLSFPPGTTLDFYGEFMFDSESGEDILSLNSGTTLTLKSTLLTNYNAWMDNNSASHSPTSVDCSISTSFHGNTPNSYPNSLNYFCHVPINADTSLSGFTLQFRATSGSTLWTYNNPTHIVYVSSYVVTDNDFTPSDTPFQYFDINGNDSDNAPGYAGNYGDITSDGINWTSSLTNLFNFTFINPFSPLFSLFTSSSSCVNIPILASMLHSNETTYCPWFSSTTRDILTPVLGISSMMLLFGFLVRWLGSSSGNMFEDQTSHRWGNTQIRQKGEK